MGTREQGFIVCQLPDGTLERGPLATGTRTGLSLPHDCLRGVPVYSVHTHPPDDADLIPSGLDMESGQRGNLNAVCVASSDWQHVQCYKP